MQGTTGSGPLSQRTDPVEREERRAMNEWMTPAGPKIPDSERTRHRTERSPIHDGDEVDNDL